jgi:bifunctional non-homologous end joining protein LigD
VAEVEFTEWTSVGSLRHPVYKGLRDDKDPREVMREVPPSTGGDGSGAGDAGREAAPPQSATRSHASAGGRRSSRRSSAAGAGGVAAQLAQARAAGAKTAHIEVDGRELALSNLDKVLYPEVPLAKADVIGFYAAIAPVLIPHLRGRALTVTRWPDGVDGKSFFQKQAPDHRPDWVETVTLRSESKPIDYLLAGDLPTVVWLANLAALELHTPLALAAAPDRPATVVFDLDPGAPAAMLECCEVGMRLHDLFTELGLESFAKTSGSKGLQVYVPLNEPAITFSHTKPFAKAVAEVLAGAEPDLIVSTMTKARRTGKVLIDWSQNDARKTTVCAYSLRKTPRATVSAPLAWDEVRAARDAGDAGALSFEPPLLLSRVEQHGDLFAPVLSLVQRLPSF